MPDHDQRFKNLLREFLALFLELFFPAWLGLLDLSEVDWLQQEMFPDPPQGDKFIADLVARITTTQEIPPLRPGEQPAHEVILHLEVESREALTELRPRLRDYHLFFRRRYHIPVLSAALYLRVALRGRGTDSYEESFQGVRSLTRWPYVGLPGLNALTYLRGSNLLGVALSVLMKIKPERRPWLAAEALRRIVASEETVWRKKLLGECVMAYGLTDAPQRAAFNQLLAEEQYREVRTNMKTWLDEQYEEMEKKGEKAGMRKEQRRFLRRQLEHRFGPLTPSQVQRLNELSDVRIDEIGLELLTASSLADLGLAEAQLNGHATNE